MDHKNNIKEFFNCRAEQWDNICCHSDEKIEAILTFANVQQGDRIVDIACGTGILFQPLLKRNPKEILGIDFSDQMIAVAQNKFHNNRIRLIASDLFEVNENEFDLAIVYSAYPHFPNKRKLAEHISSLLKPGGRVMIAHSESKEMINKRHSESSSVQAISSTLRSVQEEAENFTEFFHIDTLVDTPQIYVLSGTKKK